MTDQEKFDLATSFKSTIEEILYTKSKIVFKEFEKINKKKIKLLSWQVV